MPPKKKAATKAPPKAKAPVARAPEREGTAAHGMERAMKTMTGKWPRLYPQPGERVRFHFLTDGGDTWFCSSKHHRIGEGRDGDDFVCLRALTDGLEECQYCAAGDRELVNRFGMWLYIHMILHPSDNPKINDANAPEEQRQSWPQAKVAGVVMFKEVVEKPLFLQMSAGRSQKWFKQFSKYWVDSGDLRIH